MLWIDFFSLSFSSGRFIRWFYFIHLFVLLDALIPSATFRSVSHTLSFSLRYLYTVIYWIDWAKIRRHSNYIITWHAMHIDSILNEKEKQQRLPMAVWSFFGCFFLLVFSIDTHKTNPLSESPNSKLGHKVRGAKNWFWFRKKRSWNWTPKLKSMKLFER